MDMKSILLTLGVMAVVTVAQESQESTQKIESFHVISDIRYRFATTQMVSVVRNTADSDQEIRFDVTLPKEAFIMHFEMAIDGKVYEGEVKEKKEARRQYQEAVDRGQSAGHVAQAARHANLFDVSVNVASGSAVNFTLTYQELLTRKLGVYQHEVHVRPGQPVEDFMVKVFIKDKVPITMIKTPSVKTDYLITNEAEEQAPDYITVLQRDPTSAYIEYLPSLEDQGEEGLNARFLMQYDVEHGDKGDLLVVDGYFVHFFAPSIPPMPKDIIFVLDKSGSMLGRKNQQLKTAMKSILKDLMPEDRFNIITFSDRAHTWKAELSPADNDVKAEAVGFVESIGASGGTNMNDALLLAVRSLQKREIKSRAPLVFFLTDGQATSGVTSDEKIKTNIRSANEGVVSVISLAFGNDADYELLKGISGQNAGFARKIYEASDSALQVSSLYKEISAVVMRDLQVNYLESSVDKFSITQNDFPVVFNGTEIIVCGHLDRPTGRFEMDISGVQKDGDLNLKFSTNNVEHFSIEEPDEGEVSSLFESPRDFAGIVERMWAFLNIKQMLKEREKGLVNETASEDLKQKIIRMAVKYKFVTPLTSMVVTKPEEEGQPKEKVESGLTDVDDIAHQHRPGLPSRSKARPQAGYVHSSRRMLRKRPQPRGPPGASGAMYDLNSMPVAMDFDPGMPPMLPPTRSATYAYYPATSSPRTRRPQVGGRGGRRGNRRRNSKGNRRGNRRGNRKGSTPVPAKLVLATIILEDVTGTVCAVPKRWQSGNYSILAKQSKGNAKSAPVTLEVSVGLKRLNDLVAVHIADGTSLRLTSPDQSTWQFSTNSASEATVVNSSTGAKLEYPSGSEFPSVTVEIVKKTRRVWYVSVTLSGSGQKGLSFKKAVRSKANKRAKQWCEFKTGNYSNMGFVTGRKARKFLVK